MLIHLFKPEETKFVPGNSFEITLNIRFYITGHEFNYYCTSDSALIDRPLQVYPELAEGLLSDS